MNSIYIAQMAEFDGRSVEPFRRIAAELPRIPESIARMLDLARSHPEPSTEVGTSWIIKDLLENGVEPPDGLTDAVIELLRAVEPADARLHLLQCLTFAPPDGDTARRLFLLLLPMLEDRNAFVRAWAYNALGLSAEADSSLREPVLERLDAAMEFEKASVRVRIRKAKERLAP